MSATITHEKAFGQILSLNDLRKRAPSAFTKIPANRVSSRYIPIPTSDIIEDLHDLNWFPIDGYEVKPKREENKGFQKHFVRLRNPKKYVGTKDAISIIPELLIVNSYDARCSCKFYLSLFRVVCANGIVLKSDQLESIYIPHKGDKHEDYEELRHQLLNNLDVALKLRNDMASLILTPQQQKDFAKECYRARWDYKYPALDPKSLLKRWREEDEQNDLWTVLNVIQEKLIRGGWVGSGGRTIKPMKDRNRELAINTKLFQIAENFYQQITKTK